MPRKELEEAVKRFRLVVEKAKKVGEEVRKEKEAEKKS